MVIGTICYCEQVLRYEHESNVTSRPTDQPTERHEGSKGGYTSNNRHNLINTGIYILAISLSKLNNRDAFEGGLEKNERKRGEKKRKKE